MLKPSHIGQSTKYKQSIWRPKVGKKTVFVISCLTLCSAHTMQLSPRNCTQRARRALNACTRMFFLPRVTVAQDGTKLKLTRENGSVATIEDIMAENPHWIIPVYRRGNTTQYGKFTQHDLNILCAGAQTYFLNNGTEVWVRLEDNGTESSRIVHV